MPSMAQTAARRSKSSPPRFRGWNGPLPRVPRARPPATAHDGVQTTLENVLRPLRPHRLVVTVLVVALQLYAIVLMAYAHEEGVYQFIFNLTCFPLGVCFAVLWRESPFTAQRRAEMGTVS